MASRAMTEMSSTASTSSAGEESSSGSTLKEKLHHIGEKVREGSRAEKRASTGEVASCELIDARDAQLALVPPTDKEVGRCCVVGLHRG